MTIPAASRSKFQHAFELRESVEDNSVYRGQLPAVMGSMTQKTQDVAVAYAVERIRPFVCQCLVENWRKTGMGATGEMERHLRRSKIFATIKGGNAIIRIFLDPDAQGDTKYKTSPFIVAASLNFGAVRMKKTTRQVKDVVTGRLIRVERIAPLGKSAKASIKKLAITGKMSKKSRDAISRGFSTKLGGGFTQGYEIGKVQTIRILQHGDASVKFSGGAVVIPPRPFFMLTMMQRGALVAGFIKHVQEFFGMKETKYA